MNRYAFWIREIGEEDGEFVGWENGHIDNDVEYEYRVEGLKERLGKAGT